MANTFQEQSNKMFEDQFEPQGADYLYRRSQRAAPILVSAAERDRFVEEYRRGAKWRMRGLMLAILLGAMLMIIAHQITGTQDTVVERGIFIGCCLALAMAVFWWAWNAPARQLRGRPAMGQARSLWQADQAIIAKRSYGDILAMSVLGGVILARIDGHKDLWSDENLLIVCLTAFLFLGMLVQLYRKWRVSRRANVDA